MSDRQFPCQQCGAGLEYNPGVASLKCPYCGFVTQIPQSKEEVRELDFAALAARAQVADAVLANATGERRCDGCGAQIVIQANVATDLCPFCGTHLETPITAAQPMMTPGGVLPFSVEEQAARAKFSKWVASRWFAPNNFRRMADLGRVSGLYVPYWTYDAMTWTWYEGQRGDYYYVTVGSGKDKRTERRTRWSHASGKIDHWFDDVLVCASKSVPPNLVTALEPWDLKDAQPYAPEYLSGFRTERYQVDATEGFAAARGIMDGQIRVLIKQDIGGDEQHIHSVNTQVGGVTFKHLLLPIWLAAYRYGDRSFRVLVNARTGEVQGERPWSWIKITLFVLFIVAVVGILITMGQKHH